MNIIKVNHPVINTRVHRTHLCIKHITPLRIVKVNSNEFTNTIVESSYWIGKSIILFTMFYCTLQWNMYRNIRKKKDDEE
jgi:hypothetical protein